MFKCGDSDCNKEYSTQQALNAHKVAHKEGSRYSISRVGPIKTFICLHCGNKNKWSHSTKNKFCNLGCQHSFQHNKLISIWKETSKLSKGAVKRYLAEQVSGCWECGITEWNQKPIVLDLEHKDGNSENNAEDNLSLLCPNCHSQTSTYKNRNKGNGRHARRERYVEGLSY
jgi:hypothetical protein